MNYGWNYIWWTTRRLRWVDTQGRFKKHFNRFTFKKVAAAIDASGLADELNTGDYTIFAPTDAGMDEYAENADLDALLADNAKLQEFLKYHKDL